MTSEQEKFYKKITDEFTKWEGKGILNNNKWSHYFALAPKFFELLCDIESDVRLTATQKKNVKSAISYFISPVDFIPEAVIGPIGYLDDIALAGHVLKLIADEGNEDVLQSNWKDSEDIVSVVNNLDDDADEMLGSGIWDRIKRSLG